ncbi:flagellar basal-body MS-ring/collar protein FliF [Lichenicoccus roseus]|uniref:Flagellar M-ring protein n=1 Tax=Lichenicoccus roseus TaxID=2683649 RepID=A0A5R9J1Z5_9PROT|nr:flagellar basal-body MS-ring/collar protein FliF [Lichenicoccus roseus]TLU70497.1 flagellar M-ring protein FliF [Lichenicoccus roseus]
MKALLAGLGALGPARLAAMGAVALAMLAMLAVLATHGGGTPHMALLYGDLDMREAGQIADALDKAHIQHELGGQDDRIMVPADQVAAARLLLAKSGLPSGGSVGYEIFDRGDSLTATQFEQTINQTRALEGELARSIRLITGIRAARVHLVLPHREPFASEEQPAQASVLLSMTGSNRLDPEAVQAVVNLVSAAVPGLKVANIAIIDSRGNVLARAGQPTGALGVARNVDELRQATEIRLAHAVEEMLEPSLGAEHVRAEAAVTMDLDQIHETQESYNPDQQVLRSQQTTSDKSHNTEADATTSVQNNLPNANAGQAQTGSAEEKQDETNNYEIGKTVRTLVQDQPRIARVSLAVMVDGINSPGANGKFAWKARSQAELDQISTLVKSAIGFDPKRGDSVSVVSMQFTLPDTGGLPSDAPGFLGLHLSRDDVMRLGQNGLLGLFVLLALLFVVRPTVLRLTSVTTTLMPDGQSAIPGDVAFVGSPGGAVLGAARASGGQALLAAPDTVDGEDGLISIANISGRLKASSIRQIVELVGAHPEESLSIVRSWLGHERETG